MRQPGEFRILIAAATVLVATTAIAEPQFDYTTSHSYVARWAQDPECTAVLVDGDLIYLDEAYPDPYLRVMTCAGPGSLTEIGRLAIDGFWPFRFYLDNDRLLALSQDGVHFFDVSDPT